MSVLMYRHALIALSVLVICGRFSAGQAEQSFAQGALSTARLIAAPHNLNDRWVAGVAIALKPKAITYWRDPGEAGMPPAFDFSGSANVARAEVAYPVPKHIQEGDIDAIGYENEVVFPVRVTPAREGEPATLRLKLDYATCERICLPAHADLTLDLPPRQEATDEAKVVAALAAVPRTVEGAALNDFVEINADRQGDAISWRVMPKAPVAQTSLFAEAQDGFFYAVKREGLGFRVSVVEHPVGRPAPETVRVTLAQPGSAIEFNIRDKP